jgi:hypothetical protein
LVSSRSIHTRVVRDAGGTVWHVTESLAHGIPGALAATCLIFDSAAACHRYWSYPADWRDRTDVHLLDFMNQARLPIV